MWDTGGGQAFADAAARFLDAGVPVAAICGAAVVDGNLVTAGPQSPVQFASATLAGLGLFDERTRDAYEGVFHRADPAAFPALMQATAGGA
jgi:hypothetical protein